VTDQQRLADLTELLTRLGAPDPSAWARSELEEDIPQVARFLFLRQAWQHVVVDGDKIWIDAWRDLAAQSPSAPCAGIGPALERLIAAGADRDDLTTVVRVMQYSTLFGLCYLLDDPGEVEPEVAELGWALVEVDEEGTVGRHIGALYESLLETDPSGREMRPRDVAP
jgi:hypothetical protein